MCKVIQSQCRSKLKTVSRSAAETTKEHRDVDPKGEYNESKVGGVF